MVASRLPVRSDQQITAFPLYAEPVVPSDSTEFDIASTIYVGTAGNVKVLPLNGDTPVTFVMQDGSYVPVMVRRVYATDTDALDMVRIY